MASPPVPVPDPVELHRLPDHSVTGSGVSTIGGGNGSVGAGGSVGAVTEAGSWTPSPRQRRGGPGRREAHAEGLVRPVGVVVVPERVDHRLRGVDVGRDRTRKHLLCQLPLLSCPTSNASCEATA
jgi:hypothetical protein